MALDYTVDESGNYAFVTKSIEGNGKHTSITPQERAEAVRRVKSGEGMPRSFR